MNTQRAIVLIASFYLLCLALVLLRPHLRDLFEVGRTYSTFHQYIHQHPDILFRYNSSSPPNQSHPQLVPNHLHQIYLHECDTPSSLSKHLASIQTCTTLHPSWTHSLWTSQNATTFITTHYPSLLPSYTSYRQPIQRANMLRYAVLHHFGGVYLDLDMTCHTPLDNLVHLPFLTPGAYPAGINNAFILARPEHPFLAEVVRAAPRRNLKWGLPYVENMLSTGCMYFSNRWMGYVRRQGNVAEDERVFVLADENGALEPHMLKGVVETPVFGHGGASSWHGWDAGAIIFLGRHYRWVVLGVLVLVAKVCVFRIWKLGTRLRRGSWKGADEEDVEKRFLQ